MYIIRDLEKTITKCFFKGKIIILYGARQVGKTTLVRHLLEHYEDAAYLNCDEADVREQLTDVTSTALKHVAGKHRIVFIDEAQRVKNIGLTLKLFADMLPDIQVVATGSSSLDLSNTIVEPLTGRTFTFVLHPFSLRELQQLHSNLELRRLTDTYMVTGFYPGIVTAAENKGQLLKELASSYLYQDILQYQDVRNPEVLDKLLQALALQVGSEVSYNELASLLNIHKHTVAHYVDLLKKTFVLHELRPFSRNLRNELKKMRKLYFHDNGIRNALINNLNDIGLRQDAGALWENFMITERLKNNAARNTAPNTYFWRTHTQQEIDYLEDAGGKLSGFEFKWGKGKARVPAVFLETYKGSSVNIINQTNYMDFAGLEG